LNDKFWILNLIQHSTLKIRHCGPQVRLGL
jgi:hypothetical protein